MNRQQMVRAERCRECGAKGHTPHTDECSWIGTVCEYQLQAPSPVDSPAPPAAEPCPCGGPLYEGVPMHKLDCPVLHGKELR